MSSIFQADIIEDYKQLYESEEGYDVKIYIGEDENDLDELHAHSVVLRSRSPYFRRAFSDEWMKKQDGYFIFKKPNFSVSVFKVILKFIYCGTANISNIEGTEIVKILNAADELGLIKFIEFIQEFLIMNKIKILHQDPTIICPIAHQGPENLTKIYLETICHNPEILFESDKFFSIEEDVIILILKSDELAMDEIKIWNCLIKWGIEQTPKLKNDPKKLTDQDFITLEKRLHNCIPLIRFRQISTENFYLKVWPFKKIISEEFINDTLNGYLVPNSTPFYNVLPPRISPLASILIGKNHAIIFSNWIDKRSSYYNDYRKLPYKFELIFRSSQDGPSPINFHKKCDNQGPNIVVAS
ncbi:hypothetical protein Glove_340g71 [Diversispora epigaea]|uniref:BTB domain-containing protein n=1 Tax=Diversispora epigaea TaxID=1348612 RepID=A0A397HM16_9GLOM|nr:hypothetical protein Glove_340g71 [Diversispora epigaea]